MFRDDLLRDKVIAITGGGTGLGRSMAERFAALGARLVLASRRREVLERAAGEIRQRSGAEVLVHPLDVRDPQAVEAMVHSACERFGRLDGLVNNAAGNFLARTESLSANAFDAVVRTVLHGSFYASTAFARHVIARGGGGVILNILTTYAWTGSAFVVPSACAKAGVLAMTRSLAVEWARHGIRVNAIAPGPFPTEGAWQRLMPPGFAEQALRRIPAGRFGRPEELAELACFLLADGAAYITGECVTIDGGRWLMAGEFNALIGMDPASADALFAMLRAGPRS
ncbi:MAG: short-chain dehydrogenase [Planctomycetota bacterium]|nr:MAG: short-chain dehydrogenase [Planctomycetota bacterium]